MTRSTFRHQSTQARYVWGGASGSSTWIAALMASRSGSGAGAATGDPDGEAVAARARGWGDLTGTDPRAAGRSELPCSRAQHSATQFDQLDARARDPQRRSLGDAELEKALPAIHVAQRPDQHQIGGPDPRRHRGLAQTLGQACLAADVGGEHVPQER